MAFGDYLGALYVSIGELRDLPPSREPNLVNQAAGKLRTEQGAWVARRRAERRITGDRYRDVAARFAAAAAHLQTLPLDPELEAAVEAANDYAQKLGEDRSPELIGRWPEVRARLLAASEYLNV